MQSLGVRATEGEQMDAPGLDPGIYARVLGDLARVNTVTLARRPTLDFIRRATGNRPTFRLLDVGFGHGDMLRAIARWAEHRGVAVELVGIDLNPSSAKVAKAATPQAMPIRFLTGDYADLAGEHWDMIVSSLVAHHMTPAELKSFLRFMEREARRGWMINDLRRHAFAYYGFPVLARMLGWHRIVREDGQLSIARSWRRPEWLPILEQAEINPARVAIRHCFPFRLCVERIR